MSVLTSLPHSERLICGAFLELLRERSYASVRVRDIVERSGVGRTTFYLHYRDKADLLDCLENLLVAGLVRLVHKARAGGPDKLRDEMHHSYPPAFVEYFSYMRADKLAFQTLAQPRPELHLVDKIIGEFRAFDLHIYDRSWRRDGGELEKYWDILTRNYVNIMVDWIVSGMETSDEGMAAIIAAFWRAYVFDYDSSTVEFILGELKSGMEVPQGQ